MDLTLRPATPQNNDSLSPTIPPKQQQQQPSGKDIHSDLLGRLSTEYSKLSTIRNLRSQDSSSVHTNSYSRSNTDEERVILISRRLPICFIQGDDAVWRAEAAPINQAVQNICTVHNTHHSIWIGLSGVEVEPGTQRLLVEMLRRHRMLPIFLNQSLIEKFHTGFCRSVLWPLYHSSMPTTEDTIARHDAEGDGDESASLGGEMDMWQAYKAVNQHFADAIQSIYQDGDLIWVHDYHFMLLPQMLKHVLPAAKISFFLHLPFPSSEIYRVLPYRDEILEGMVSADIIGFQTYDYARHFLTTIESLLEATCSPKGVEYNGHFAHVSICPVGIIPEHWSTMARSDEVKNLMERWRKVFCGRRVLLGADGLDPTKGLTHKLLAVEEMFDRNQKLADTVTFVQVCFTSSASSTGDVDILMSQIHAMSAHINSKLASAGEEGPIKVFVDVNPQELCTMYCLADVLVVTPIRDGMNVIPFEYNICRESHGRLATVVLSEFAGCARSLGGALLVNPWSTSQLADTMQTAMDMDLEERAIRHSNMIHYIRNFTSESWSQASIADLHEAKEGENETTSRLLPDDHVVQTYDLVQWRLLVFSLERVLVKETCLPELLSIPVEVVESLSELSLCPTNMVVVKSRRTKEILERLLGHTNCVLAAECGAFVKWGRHSDWETLWPDILSSATTTRAVVEPVLQYYTERTPGSVIEIREASIAWHYSDCDIGHGEWQAKQLHVSLLASKGAHVSVFYGDNVLEVMPQGLCTLGESFFSMVVGRMRQLLRAHEAASIGLFWTQELQSMRLLQHRSPLSLSRGFKSKNNYLNTFLSGSSAHSGGSGTDGNSNRVDISGELLKDAAQPMDDDGQRIWPFVEVEVTGEETGLKGQFTCMILEAPLEWQEAKGIFHIDRALNEPESRPNSNSPFQSAESMEQEQQQLRRKCTKTQSNDELVRRSSLLSYTGSQNSNSSDIEFILVVASGQEFNDEYIFGTISSELGLDIKDFVECVAELAGGEEGTCKIMMDADDDDKDIVAAYPRPSGKALAISGEGEERGQVSVSRNWPPDNSVSSLTSKRESSSNRPRCATYGSEGLLKNQLQSVKQYLLGAGTNSKLGGQRDNMVGQRQAAAALDFRLENSGKRMMRDENSTARSHAHESTKPIERPANDRRTQTKASSTSDNTTTRHGMSPAKHHRSVQVAQDVVDDSNNDLLHDGLNRMKLRNTASQRAEIIAQSQFRPRKNFPPKTMLFQAMKEKLPSNCSHWVVPDTAAACWAMVLSSQDGRNESWREIQDLNAVQETSIDDPITDRDKEIMQQESVGAPRIPRYQFGYLEKSLSKANLLRNIDKQMTGGDYSPSMMDPAGGKNTEPYSAVEIPPQPLNNFHYATEETSTSSEQPPVSNNKPSSSTGVQDASNSGPINEAELEEGLRLTMNVFSCTVGLRLSQASFYLKRYCCYVSIHIALVFHVLMCRDSDLSSIHLTE